jgi:hypothetical protein
VQARAKQELPLKKTISKEDQSDADNQPTTADSPHKANIPEQGSGDASLPAKAWRLHTCLYNHTEEAELGTS